MMKNRFSTMAAALILAWSCLSGNARAFEAGGVDIHGFVSQGFLWSDTYNYLTNDSKKGSFQYNEVGVNFGKDLTEKLRMGVQLFSRDLGDAANNKVTIDWAYGDYRLKDWFGIRAGRIKLPLGFYNETRDIDLLRTSIVMPQSLYPDLLRDTVIAANGAGIYGNIPLSSLGSLDYQTVAGAVNVDNASGYEKWFNSKFLGTMSLNGETDSETAYAGSLRWNTPLEGLVLGISGMTVDGETPVRVRNVISTSQLSSNTLLVYSAEYTWRNLVLSGEYQTFEVDSTILGRQSVVTSMGYYLSAAYRFTDWFTLGGHYSVLYPNKDDKDGTTYALASDAWEKDLALSLRFDINDYTVFKLEGHRVDGTARVLSADNPNRSQDDFYYGAAKITFSF